MDIDPRHRDFAIRTILGEAANEPDEGQAAVAAVILNRLNSGKWGKSIPEVVTARHQFEPWSTQQGRSRMFGYTPDSQPYQRASAALDAALGGNDPTKGATHFFSPTAQAALGRQPPSWAQGEGQPIGRHTFYAPEGRAQMAQMQNSAAGLPEGFQIIPQQQSRAPALPEGFQLVQQPSFGDRFAAMETPQANPQLQAGLENRAQAMTRGSAASPVQQMATDFANIIPAVSQGTSPNVDQYKGNLVSREVFQGDDGSVLYRDPQTGQVVPTDNTKHVVIRDPADNTPKVYARTEATNESAAVGVARALAPGLAAGAPTARAAIPAASAAKTVRASDIFSTAKPAYRAFEQEAAGIPIPPQAAAGYVTRIKDAMKAAKVPQHLADEVYKSVDEIATADAVTPEHLRSVKELIGQSSRSIDSRVRQAAGVANKEISKIIGELTPEGGAALKRADDIYSTAKSVQELQRKGDIAGLRTGRAGYGGNAVNSMRQVLSPIVQRSIEGKTTGFKPNEIAAIRDIIEGDAVTNAARQVGAMSPSKGIMQIGLGTVTGGVTAALGMAGNKLATVLTGKQIDRLKELVAKRSPAYADAVRKSVERYEKAQMEFVNKPSPNTFAAYISGSRALSSGLTRDGIQVSSGDLLRAIQNPMKSAAEGEEPAVPGRPGE